jgi:hypothetical protein
MTTKHNDPKQFAYDLPAGANFILTDTVVDNGGIVRAAKGAKSIHLTRVAGTGQITGSGVYRVILATKPVQEFVWDNTGLDTEIVNGGEAGIRVMGGAVNVTLINVNFRCRKHDRGDDTGKKSGTPGVKQDYWKQIQQWRDVRNGLVRGGRTIGPIDIGEQKNTALTSQHVDNLTFDNHAMTSLPTITSRKSVGKIIIRNCPKIDANGKVIGKWKDQQL